ncbi:MAG: hypothetical protein GYA24_25665 [Candidatus Lokiarchaeota archaeon]|nr:hypothetical protein [Candidatus Lokiarchaeota archaeon]
MERPYQNCFTCPRKRPKQDEACKRCVAMSPVPPPVPRWPRWTRPDPR